MAVEAGADVLAVQGSAAGGHSGTLTPSRRPPAVPTAELVADVHRAVDRPLVAAGGVARPVDVVDAVRAGASAVMVGTVLLRAPESGASAAHQAALADADRGDTVVTRAFTGRPARALRNRFVDRYDQQAPLGLSGHPPPDQPDPSGGGGRRRSRSGQPLGRHRVPAGHAGPGGDHVGAAGRGPVGPPSASRCSERPAGPYAGRHVLGYGYGHGSWVFIVIVVACSSSA